MNNIEILEDYIDSLRNGKPFNYTNERKAQAVEHLIQENKELKKEIKSLNKIIKYANDMLAEEIENRDRWE